MEREAKLVAFDHAFDPVLEALGSVRRDARELRALVLQHTAAIAAGEIVRVQPRVIEVTATIDEAVARHFHSLLAAGYRALKGLRVPLALLGTEVRFLTGKADSFERNVSGLRDGGQSDLAAYLEQVRTIWTEEFFELRRKHTHGGWRLGRFDYRPVSATDVDLVEPSVQGVDVTRLASLMANRMCELTESLIVYSVGRAVAPIEVIHEIPPAERDPACCTRFVVTMAGAAVPWQIAYSETEDFTL